METKLGEGKILFKEVFLEINYCKLKLVKILGILFLKLKNPLLENCQENLSSTPKMKFNFKFHFFLIEFKKEKFSPIHG